MPYRDPAMRLLWKQAYGAEVNRRYRAKGVTPRPPRRWTEPECRAVCHPDNRDRPLAQLSHQLNRTISSVQMHRHRCTRYPR